MHRLALLSGDYGRSWDLPRCYGMHALLQNVPQRNKLQYDFLPWRED